jgi:hypothetical protein
MKTRNATGVQKRQRAGAVQDAARAAYITAERASVLDCGGPPPLFPEKSRDVLVYCRQILCRGKEGHPQISFS